jgi:hypothetical protein
MQYAVHNARNNVSMHPFINFRRFLIRDFASSRGRLKNKIISLHPAMT